MSAINLCLASLAGRTTASWVDVACLLVLLTCIVWDAVKGFSATVAQIAALVIAFRLSFFVCPAVRAAIPAGGGLAASVAPFAAALAALVLLFFLLRFAIAKFVQVILQRPVDNIVGAFAGLVKGLLLLFLLFSLAAVTLRGSYSDTAFAKSYFGRKVFPAMERFIAASYRSRGPNGRK